MNVHRWPPESPGTSAGETSQMLLVRQLTLDAGNESYDNVKGLGVSVWDSVGVECYGLIYGLIFRLVSSFIVSFLVAADRAGSNKVIPFDSLRSAAQLAAALMTNDLDEVKAKLRRGLEQFPKIAEDMEVSRCYCFCDRRANSPCPMAHGQRQMLQDFVSDFDVGDPESLKGLKKPSEKERHFYSNFWEFECRAFWWPIRKFISSEPFLCLESSKQAMLSSVAQDLLGMSMDGTFCEPWPWQSPPLDLQFWKDIASPQMQRRLRQVIICVSYILYFHEVGGVSEAYKADLTRELKSPTNNSPLVWLQWCKDAHLELQRQKPSAELESLLPRFAREVASFWELVVKQLESLEYAPACDDEATRVRRLKDTDLAKWMRIRERRDEVQQSLSKCAALASQIAEHVALMESPEVPSENSWNVISDVRARGVEDGSVASGHSVDSQMSYLSGHGDGPKCFLPSYLFQVLRDEVSPASFVRAQDGGSHAKLTQREPRHFVVCVSLCRAPANAHGISLEWFSETNSTNRLRLFKMMVLNCQELQNVVKMFYNVL